MLNKVVLRIRVVPGEKWVYASIDNSSDVVQVRMLRHMAPRESLAFPTTSS
jgi:hypothetical protein